MSNLFFKLIKFQKNKNFNLHFAKNTNQHDIYLSKNFFGINYEGSL